uniref:Mitogen-activated protein kinase kinase kinase 1-like n=1 Tax=Nicotiana tabacum TaxID=4097 RepID=A0A1S4C4C8_TOBAC|nr:PREDICTED: mitogen-activated protein kinase kinase kinase 1-like [Nicotiana tabacum]
MYAKRKKLRPRLDRRNALRNVDYDASQSTPSSPSSFEDQPTHRTRSLDLYPLTDCTSFRIDGVGGEFDVICRSLGLSGPEDFAIPVAAWEARKPCSRSDRLRSSRFADSRRDSDYKFETSNESNRRLNYSPENVIEVSSSESEEETKPCSHSDRFSSENELESLDEVSDSVRNGVRVTVGGELNHGLNSSPENGIKVRISEPEDDNLPTDVKCGIRGSRPPRLAPPASPVDDFTSAWDFIRSFGPADDEDMVSPSRVESTSDDILGNEQVGDIIAKNEERNEDFVRSASQVSQISSESYEQGVRDAAEDVPDLSSKSQSDDSYSLISKTSSKSPSGESTSGVSKISSKSQSDDSYSLISKRSSKSPSGESTSGVSKISSKSQSDDSYSLISKRSSKSPSGESTSGVSKISSKSQSDESYTLILKPVYSVSPNGSPSIKSWQKGDFLGSGSFGTVYEGFTE